MTTPHHRINVQLLRVAGDESPERGRIVDEFEVLLYALNWISRMAFANVGYLVGAWELYDLIPNP